MHVDSTLIRADVSWESLTTEHANKVLEENSNTGIEDNLCAEDGEKKRGRPRTRLTQPKKHSTTDPEATLATSSRNRKLEPSYKQHTTVDDKAGVVVDVELTTGEINEGTKLIEGVERLEALTGKKVERITADASYAHPKNYAAMEERGTDAIIPPMPEKTTSSSIPIRRFSYDGKHKTVRCPTGKFMKCTSRENKGWLYRAKIRDCKACQLRKNCLPPTGKVRTVLIVDGYEALLRARRRKSRWNEERYWYNRHRWRVEGIHGEAKTQHGLRRAVRRGLMNVAIQVYLTAAVMNLKRLAAALLTYFWLIINRLLLLQADFKKRGTTIKNFWSYDGDEEFNVVMAA